MFTSPCLIVPADHARDLAPPASPSTPALGTPSLHAARTTAGCRTGLPPPFDRGIPGVTHRRAVMLVHRLRRQFPGCLEEPQDLYQSAILRVLAAMPRHDPALAKPTTFASAVLKNWYREKARELRGDWKRQRAAARYFAEAQGRAQASADMLFTRVDLRIDLASALSDAGLDAAWLLERLEHRSLSASAAEMGVHPATLHRRLRKLADQLRAYDPIFDGGAQQRVSTRQRCIGVGVRFQRAAPKGGTP